MQTFSIALLQLTARENDQDANLHKGLDYCRQAAELGADLAIFPELWNIGHTAYDQTVYLSNFDPLDGAFEDKRAKWQHQAITTKSDFSWNSRTWPGKSRWQSPGFLCLKVRR